MAKQDSFTTVYKNVELNKISTRAPKGLDKEEFKKKTVSLAQELDELQNLLYAQKKHSLLIVFQGMDASGKDGVIKDVFSFINPQGVKVSSFKVPTEEEKNHDFLWRIHNRAPQKGEIAVFNRSHYEDVLVTKVHGLIDDKIVNSRMDAINAFESLLKIHNDTIVIKFYLHVSHEEQLKRLNERINIPRKMWKYNQSDIQESAKWDDYMDAYEHAINGSKLPWHIIPADQNWFKSYLVVKTIYEVLSKLKMTYPGVKQ